MRIIKTYINLLVGTFDIPKKLLILKKKNTHFAWFGFQAQYTSRININLISIVFFWHHFSKK